MWQEKETEDGCSGKCDTLEDLELYCKEMGYTGADEVARNAGVPKQELVGTWFSIVNDRVYFE